MGEGIDGSDTVLEVEHLGVAVICGIHFCALPPDDPPFGQQDHQKNQVGQGEQPEMAAFFLRRHKEHGEHGQNGGDRKNGLLFEKLFQLHGIAISFLLRFVGTILV